MIIKAIAMSLHHGQTLYHKTLCNADGSAMRARVNGRCKTWKRDSDRWQLPMKYGYRGHGFYIGNEYNGSYGIESVTNPSNWDTVDPTEEAREKERIKKRRDQIVKKLGLAEDVLDGVLHDAMIDAGYSEGIAFIVSYDKMTRLAKRRIAAE